MSPKNKNRGMTAIDFIVSLTILSLLATIVITSLLRANQKSRNTIRISDMRAVQTALELYFNDHSQYPNTGGKWRSVCSFWGSFPSDEVIPGLTPTYIPSVPSDPLTKKAENDNCYVYVSNGVDYAFYDYYGTDIDFAKQPSLLDPASDGGKDSCNLDASTYMAWKISSNGGRCW